MNIRVSWPEGREPIDETAARAVWERIEWHPGCEGRHGVIRDVDDDDRDRVSLGLVYYLGEDCAHWRGRDVELVHMTKVFPPPDYPWEWCGASILWPDRREYRP